MRWYKSQQFNIHKNHLHYNKHSKNNYTSTMNFNFWYTYKYNQLIKRAILKNIKIIYIVTNIQITLINQQTISYIHTKNKHENHLHSNKDFKCTHQSINSFLINWCKELHFKKHKNHLHSKKTFQLHTNQQTIS